MVGRVEVLEQVCARARARAGQITSETLGTLTARDFCRYAVAVGDNDYLTAAHSAAASGRPVLAPTLFVTGILGWGDGPPTQDLYRDGLGLADSPCTDGLPVTQMHGGQEVEITRRPAAGSVLHADRVIEGAAMKQGQAGPFAVLRMATTFRDGQGEALVTSRESIIVLPGAFQPAQAGQPQPTAAGPDSGIMSWTPTHVQLFRFSAVSWNAHRIHYDQEFARESGFPGVVVQSALHGELLARAALTAAGEGARLRRIAWRNKQPAFAGQTLRYHAVAAGSGLAVTATDPHGRVCASADVRLSAP